MMIAIVGSGNVATHLYEALKEKTEVVRVNSRTLENFPENPDIILISVSDNAIQTVSEKIPATDAIIAHTSGSIPMNVLKGNKTGVFYPLQTFTKGIKLNYKEIPVFIEGSSDNVISKLKEAALMISGDVREADSAVRKKLHLASVFACNFTNALAGVSAEILKEAGMDLKVILPLIRQTVNKLEILKPTEAQTGPAVRGDSKVLESHIKLLESQPEYKELYLSLTRLIQKNHVL